MCVLDITKPKKVDVKTPKINGHKALVTDFDFCPFEDDVIATGSEDLMVRVWRIP